jgi:hypothetical protein
MLVEKHANRFGQLLKMHAHVLSSWIFRIERARVRASIFIGAGQADGPRSCPDRNRALQASMPFRRFALVLALVIACGDRTELPATDLAAERFATRGKVMKIEGDTFDILHEHMPKIRTFDGTLGEMPPMTMQFSATASAPGRGIAVGDAVKIEFTTHYRTPSALRLVSIEKLPPGTELALPR